MNVLLFGVSVWRSPLRAKSRESSLLIVTEWVRSVFCDLFGLAKLVLPVAVSHLGFPGKFETKIQQNTEQIQHSHISIF